MLTFGSKQKETRTQGVAIETSRCESSSVSHLVYNTGAKFKLNQAIIFKIILILSSVSTL